MATNLKTPKIKTLDEAFFIKLIKNKKTLFLILLFLPFILSASKFNASNNDTILVGIAASPATLDPRFATDATGMRIAGLIFQSLVRIDKNLKIKPMAARKWTYKNKTYTFYIPKNIQFSNGRNLLKEDLIFSIEQYKSPTNPFHSAFALIESTQVTSSKTEWILSLKLKSYSATFLNSDLPVLKILPKKETLQLGYKMSSKPIGSGSFVLTNSNANQITLRPAFKTPIKKVIFKVIRDDLTRFQKVLKKEIHIIQSELPYSKIHYLKKAKLPYRVFEAQGLSMNYMLINFKDPLFKHLKARQILAYGINKEEIIKYTLKGFASAALSILHTHNPFYNKNLKPFVYSPLKGKKILSQNNWKGKTIQIKTSNNNEVISYAKILAQQIRNLGFKVKIVSYEWGTFYGDLKKGNFQLALLRWVGAYDPDIFRIAFHSKEWPPYGRNRGFYKNQTLDRLVTNARIEENIQKRKKMYKQVQNILLKDLPIIPLWHNKQIAIVRNDINGYYLPLNGSFEFLNSISKKKK